MREELLQRQQAQRLQAQVRGGPAHDGRLFLHRLRFRTRAAEMVRRAAQDPARRSGQRRRGTQTPLRYHSQHH